MSKAKHTPGPWLTYKDPIGRVGHLITRAGLKEGAPGIHIANVYSEADACLIVNAAAMLDKLEQLADTIQSSFELDDNGVEPDGSEWPIWVEARDLINIIKGGKV